MSVLKIKKPKQKISNVFWTLIFMQLQQYTTSLAIYYTKKALQVQGKQIVVNNVDTQNHILSDPLLLTYKV